MKELQDLNNQSEYYINKVITRHSLPHLEMMLPHFKGIASTDIRRDEGLAERLVERWSELNKNQCMILSLMVENPRISRKELSKILNINQSAM